MCHVDTIPQMRMILLVLVHVCSEAAVSSVVDSVSIKAMMTDLVEEMREQIRKEVHQQIRDELAHFKDEVMKKDETIAVLTAALKTEMEREQVQVSAGGMAMQRQQSGRRLSSNPSMPPPPVNGNTPSDGRVNELRITGQKAVVSWNSHTPGRTSFNCTGVGDGALTCSGTIRAADFMTGDGESITQSIASLRQFVGMMPPAAPPPSPPPPPYTLTVSLYVSDYYQGARDALTVYLPKTSDCSNADAFHTDGLTQDSLGTSIRGLPVLAHKGGAAAAANTTGARHLTFLLDYPCVLLNSKTGTTFAVNPQINSVAVHQCSKLVNQWGADRWNCGVKSLPGAKGINPPLNLSMNEYNHRCNQVSGNPSVWHWGGKYILRQC